MHRTNLQIVLFLLLIFGFSKAQNLPEIGTISSNNINTKTTNNYLIVGNISDGDLASSQTLTVQAISSNNAILSILGTDFYTTSGQNFAKINLKQFDVNGIVTLSVTATDLDGSTTKSFDINVGFNYQKGCRWSIYDIPFGASSFPNEFEISNLDSTLTNVELPKDTLIWKNIGMTVGRLQSDAGFKFHDGYTTSYRGVIIPSLTGIYMFTMNYEYGGEFRISNSTKYNYAFQIGGFRNARENTVSNTISDTVYLVARKPYAYQATYWTKMEEEFALQYAYLGTNPTNVVTVTANNMPTNYDRTAFLTTVTNSTLPYGISYSIPGFTATRNTPNRTTTSVNFSILGTGSLLETYIYYDVFKPNSISGLSLVRKGSNVLDIKWNPTFDTLGVKKYTIYVNGELFDTTHTNSQTTYVLKRLNPDTEYTIFITATDKNGNESNISDVLIERTFPLENTTPTPPTVIQMDVLADLSAKISWSGASDAVSGIYGYRVFVDGVLYNQDTTTLTEMILKTFEPLSVHTVQIQAIDGNFNASLLSSATVFTLLGFDAMITSPGVKKLQLNITKDFVGKIDGFGINAGYSDYSDLFLNTIKDLNPGLIRWGGIEANTISYESASVGNKTYAKFIDFANRAGCAASISIGTDSTLVIDWRNEQLIDVRFGENIVSMSMLQHTANKFVNYLFAPDSMATKSIAGLNFYPYAVEVQKRLNEGFSKANLTGSTFKNLIIELGSKPWGGTSNGSPGTVDHNADGFSNYKIYGIWARKLAKYFKSNPYFDSTKVKIAYSGREPQPLNSYGLTEALFSGTDEDKVDMISVGGYLSQSLEFIPYYITSRLQYHKMLNDAIFRNINGLYATKNIDNIMRKKQRPFFFYESAVGLASYNQRFGQALPLSDYLLSSHKAGAYYPAIYSLSLGREWERRVEDFARQYKISNVLCCSITKYGYKKKIKIF